MRDLEVALIQASLRWKDPAANRAALDGLMATLDESGTSPELIVLPEMFTTGFTMDAAAHAETMDGETVAWMGIVARDYGATVCGSLIIEAGGRHFNRLVWMPPDGKLAWYDKRHLFRMADEHQHYAAGTERRVFTLGEWRVCPLVCYDLRFPVWSRGANQFDLQLFVANWPAPRRSAWQALLPARAIENQCYVIGVNRVGTDGNDIRYAGDSGAFDYLGRTLVDCRAETRAAMITLPGPPLERYRQKFPAWRDADSFTIDA